MTPDATQCQRMAEDAAAAAARDGISIEIRLLTQRGYLLWHWSGTVPPALQELAAAVPVGGRQ